VGHIHLKLNSNELTQREIDLIKAYNPDNADEVIAGEIKMRSIHAQIIALDELDLISEMVQANPNGWFVDYCNSRGIEL
jgi:hypothetical protein